MSLLPSFHFQVRWLGVLWQISNLPSEDPEEEQEGFYGFTGIADREPADEDDLTPEAPEEHTVPIGFGRYPGYLDGEDV